MVNCVEWCVVADTVGLRDFKLGAASPFWNSTRVPSAQFLDQAK